MTNECYISQDIEVTLATIFFMAGAVIAILVSWFPAFVPMKRADVQTGKIRYLSYLNGVAFFCMGVAVGLVSNRILFGNCLSIITSAIIILVGLAAGLFSGYRYKHLLFNKARVAEYQAKLREMKKAENESSNQKLSGKQNTSKGLLVCSSIVFVIAIPAIGCYLLFIGLPWFNQWVSIVLAFLIFGGFYAVYHYLERKDRAAMDRFLEEDNSVDTLA